MSLRARLALVVALLASAAAAIAYVPLRHPSTGAALYWNDGGNVVVVLSSLGSDDLEPDEHEPALRLALEAWNQVPGSYARFLENTNPVQRARTDWQADDIHLVLFDEDNSSGYFPPGNSTVAITPVWFQSNGRIVDADVLFNGSSYAFTTEAGANAFDVMDVAVHELGHMLGFDHSPVVGSSLFPYVTPGLVLHRSLASDDELAIRVRYPQVTRARIKGRIVHADSEPVARAHVVARDANGRTIGAALANGAGNFTLPGLEAGAVELFAIPLDGPVTAANLSGAPSVDTGFQATPIAQLTLPSSGDVVLGDLVVDADTTLVFGRSFDPLPLRATAGATTNHVVRGIGLVPGSTLSAPDPEVDLSVIGWFTSSVSFSVTVPAAAEPGLVDLEVVDPSGDLAILAGALEITPPDPVVSAVVPSTAAAGGGTEVTVIGSGFRPGASVVVGGAVLRDGEKDGCTVVDANTIEIELGACPSGTYDLVVIDPTGVEGRATGALAVGGEPSIASVFPPAGAHLGGTEVVLEGSGFDPGLAVTIDGVPQSVAEVEPDRVVFVTQSALPGGYPLAVTNPIGSADTASFSYAPLPDPRIDTIAPTQGPAAGGTWVTITGAALRGDLDVVFGADPSTGLGGALALRTTFVDANTLLALTPAGSGTASVVLRDPSTEQASALPAAFTFQKKEGGSGGGCGSLVETGGPGAEWMAGLWWAALLFVVCLWRATRANAALREPA